MYLYLPSDQLYKYDLTGKFVAPNANWKHERFPLMDYELIVVTSGTLYLEYDREKFTVSSGDYLLLPPGPSFRKGYKAASSSFYWVHFAVDIGIMPPKLNTPSEIKISPGQAYIIPQAGKIPNADKVVILMKQLQDLVKEKYPTSCLNAMTTTIVSELCGQLIKELSDVTNQVQKQVYLDIIDYIRENLCLNLTITEIAEHFGYNEKYLSHRFTEIVGMSLKQFILKEKSERANFLLTDSNLSISEIAGELGFSDGHNFCRAYKKITGLSPSEYRNAYSKRLLFHK